ncbi:MAG: hypothetical protein NT116_01040, partial [Candidatus Parcubacteria bacterium]|nr:hypothetical protein [Candidatus Parcubacteria bacterium]
MSFENEKVEIEKVLNASGKVAFGPKALYLVLCLIISVLEGKQDVSDLTKHFNIFARMLLEGNNVYFEKMGRALGNVCLKILAKEEKIIELFLAD